VAARRADYNRISVLDVSAQAIRLEVLRLDETAAVVPVQQMLGAPCAHLSGSVAEQLDGSVACAASAKPGCQFPRSFGVSRTSVASRLIPVLNHDDTDARRCKCDSAASDSGY
jgi:hypothetical protein